MKLKLKLKLFYFILFLVSGCSNLSKNTIEQGRLPIRNGVKNDKVWKEDLMLDRYSWYHELTLQFEFLIGKIPPQSGFNFWFSKEELETVNNCADARIVLAYSLDTKTIPYFELFDQLERNGFTKFELIEFQRNLNQHPDSNMNSFQLYHIFGICRKSNELNPLKISFPGFIEKVIN